MLLLISMATRTKPETLQQSFVRQLQCYDGVSYHLGGESRRVIDCSSLVRRGMMDACLDEAVA